MSTICTSTESGYALVAATKVFWTNRDNDFDCYIIFYTESGKYSYTSYYGRHECDRSTIEYLIDRQHVFQKYDPEIDDWLVVDIDRITLPND